MAQIPAETFKHIIIVVQENRTPDNLFGAVPTGTAAGTVCGVEDPFMTGVDIENGGYGWVPVSGGTRLLELICSMSLPLSGYDSDPQVQTGIDHDHDYDLTNPPCKQLPCGWVADYDSGARDGFCHEFYDPTWAHPCPSYSYVPLGDPHGDISPYYQIAQAYGFGNYMFQTSEGPSFPAHQFVLSGTSAPVAPGVSPPDYLDFVAELVGSNYGCPSGAVPYWVTPEGTEISGDPTIAECYAHDTLVTAAAYCPPNNQEGFCDRPGITWGYYAPAATGSHQESIWIAPLADPQTCYGSKGAQLGNPACPSGPNTEFGNHVHLAGQNGYSQAPIFDDLYNCSKPFPAISWVIPDMNWSDHAMQKISSDVSVYGPSWVGDIIDGVGEACGGKYWGLTQQPEPTAVIVTWDDWGGWFDHIAPWAYYRSGNTTSCPTGDAPNGWGCGYVSGFRVPLLVVSPYTGTPTSSGPTNYVSGACGPGTPNGNCPNFGKNNVYVHDFGSILAFTEYNFGLPNIDQVDNGYADCNAPDWGSSGCPNGNIPLLDFFGLYPNARQFVSITTDKLYTWFQQASSSDFPGSTYPGDPDDD